VGAGCWQPNAGCEFISGIASEQEYLLKDLNLGLPDSIRIGSDNTQV